MPRRSIIRNHLWHLLLALGIPGCLGVPSAMADTTAQSAAPPAYTGSYIVRWRDAATSPNGSDDKLQRVFDATGIALSVKRGMAGQLQLLTPGDAGVTGSDPEAVAAKLRQDPRIADAVPDRWLRLHDTLPNDPEFGNNQPYMQGTSIAAGGANLPRAWDRSRGSSGIVIAVIDTGILPHPDLAGRVLPGFDFIANTAVANDGDARDADPTDPGDNVPADFTCPDGSKPGQSPNSWHGTRVSGVIGAVTDNGLNIAGVDWNARLLPLRVSGRCGALLSDTVDAMRWASGISVPGVPDNPTPARVVNISLGGGTCTSIEQQTIKELAARNTVVVAAAGNERGSVDAPADCSGVVSVTAHVNDGETASYSNFGPQVTLSAPGGGCGVSKVNGNTCSTAVSVIRTLSNDGRTSLGAYTVSSSAGTSFAAPMVSGVIGLMLALKPTMTPGDVITALKSSARPHPVGTFCAANANACGAGLLNADGALTAALTGPVTAPAPAASSGGGGGGAWSLPGALALLGAGIVGFATRRRPRTAHQHAR